MTALLVLGGADGALSTLRAAKAIGLRTICADLRADAPAAGVADRLLNVSSRDVDALVAAVRGSDVAGVVSPASDVNVPAQYAIARRLGLPCGLSEPAVRASVDKGYFRAVCDRLGQPGPRWLQGSPAEVRAGAWRLGAEVMVKPTDSSGSRGVSKAARPGQLADAIDAAAGHSSSGVVIAEEYLHATHLTVEAVVESGRVALLGISERLLTEPPHFVTVQHLMSAHRSDLLARIRRMLDELCAALDYRWGALNVDVMVGGDGAVIIGEWGARLGGNGMAELLHLATGVDATTAYVRMSLGTDVDLTARHCRIAASRMLGAAVAGKLAGIDGVDAARAIPGVADIVLAVNPGEHVAPYTAAGTKLGYVLAEGSDRAATLRCLDAVEATLIFTVEPE